MSEPTEDTVRAEARAWLEGIKANEPTEYPKNSPIVKALADGEIQVGLPNHYYLLRITDKDPDYPVAQAFFKDGDIGNLVNVSGIGILRTGKNRAAADKFAEFLLSTALHKLLHLLGIRHSAFTATLFHHLLHHHRTAP